MPDIQPILDLNPIDSIREASTLPDQDAEDVGIILTFTNNGPGIAWIDVIRADANLDGEFFLHFDNEAEARDAYRTSPSELTANFTFPRPQKLVVGSKIQVKGLHHITGKTALFRASLFGHR